MTRDEIEANKAETIERVTRLSTAAVTAITALEAVTEELNTSNASVARLNTENTRLTRDLASANARVTRAESNQNNPSASPRASTPEPAEVSMNFERQPGNPDTARVVRFLSKSSAMGGLANIRAYMNDLGVNAKRMRLEGSTYTPPTETLVINWGGGFEMPSNISGFTGRHLNKLEAIKVAASKLKTFNKLNADDYLKEAIPEFTVDRGEATWPVVYARKDLYGHSGEGIVVVRDGGTLPPAPLYVEGLNIKHEYRVHCVNGFTKIQKKARLGTENPNMEVRNLDGGWTFINEFTLGDRGRSELHDLANKTINCLGLDFGAVDIIRTEENTWKVLEVNTAPGVTADSNIEWYAKALLTI